MKHWQEGNHFLFSACSYVTLNKLFCLLLFPCWGRKRKNTTTNCSLVFDSCTHLCAFLSFLKPHLCVCFPPRPLRKLPKCWIADASLD
uniref:Secreted protein n=1 Tax=Ursus americanus TaxID=9643 RepID=A0A452QQU2_URSAM